MQSSFSHDHSEYQWWHVESVPCLRNRALIWLWCYSLNFLNQICVVSFSIPFCGNVSYSLYQFCLHLQNIRMLYHYRHNNFKISKKFEIITFLNVKRIFSCKNESPMSGKWQNNTAGQSCSGWSGFSVNMFGFQLDSILYSHGVGRTHTEFWLMQNTTCTRPSGILLPGCW